MAGIIPGARWDLEGSARRDAEFVAWLEEHGLMEFPTVGPALVHGLLMQAAPARYHDVTVSVGSSGTRITGQVAGCEVTAYVVDGELRPAMTPEREARELRQMAARARSEATRLDAAARLLEASS